MKNNITLIILMAFFLQTCSLEKKSIIEEAHITELNDKAKLLLRDTNYPEALPLLQKMVESEFKKINDKEVEEHIKVAVNYLMYCYIYTGNLLDGLNYFMYLYENKETWLMNNGVRCIEFCLANLYYMSGRLQEATEMVEAGLKRPEKQQHPELLSMDYAVASNIYFQTIQLNKAIEFSEKSLTMPHGELGKSRMYNIRVNLIYMYYQVGDFEKCFSTYEDLINTPEFNEIPDLVNLAEMHMAVIFSDLGLADADSHIQKAKTDAHSSKRPDALIPTYILEIGYLFQEDSNLYKIAALKDSMALYLPPPEQNSYYHLFYEYIDCAYNLWTLPASNRQIIHDALTLMSKFKTGIPDRSAVNCYQTLSRAFYARGEIDHAINGFESCVDYLVKNNIWYGLKINYFYLAKLYEVKNNHIRSNEYYQLHDKAKDRYQEGRNEIIMSQFRVRYKTFEKEQENKLLETELEMKKRTIFHYTVSGIAFIVIILLVLSWLFTRNRILELKHEADVRMKEIERFRRQEAQSLIQKQKEELHRMLNERLELNRKNEELRVEIEKSGTQTQLQDLMNDISPRLLTEEEEIEFRRKFSFVYPGFIKQLRELIPGITPAEEILSMLIGLKLNNREISLALGIHIASVHTARSRLRKKFDISKKESLEDFIRKFQ